MDPFSRRQRGLTANVLAAGVLWAALVTGCESSSGTPPTKAPPSRSAVGRDALERQIVKAARKDFVAIADYSYATFNADTARAERHMTAEYRSRFASTVAKTRRLVLENHQSLTAVVNSVEVLAASASRATVHIYARLVTRGDVGHCKFNDAGECTYIGDEIADLVLLNGNWLVDSQS